MQDLLEHLCRLTEPRHHLGYRFAGLARMDAKGMEHWQFVAGEAHLGSPRFRCASISKMATALAVNSVIAQGGLSLCTPVAPLLGWSRDPGMTVLHLLNHTSGLTDLGGYIFDPPDPLRDILDNPHSVSGHSPGRYFRYSNLNYILLGQVLEAATGERFDRVLHQHVLGPAEIYGGFNWANVPIEARGERQQMIQRRGDIYVTTADAEHSDWEADLLWRDGVGRSLTEHRPVLDAPYFSPHAGLRASLPELARLAWFLGDTGVGRATAETTWRYDPAGKNGEDCGGLFPEYGRGVTIYRDHPLLPGHLIGHAGHALGFTGGAWFNLQTRTAWAYGLIGAADQTEDLEDEVFFPPEELQFMQAF